MEPLDINAGEYYLRPLWDDGRINDLQQITAVIPEADADYLAMRARGWELGTSLSWAVCHQNDVTLLAELVLTPSAPLSEEGLAAGTPDDPKESATAPAPSAVLTGWIHPAQGDHTAGISAAAEVVHRFAQSLGIEQLTNVPLRVATAASKSGVKIPK